MMNHLSFPLIVLTLGSIIGIGCSNDDSSMVREGHLVKLLYEEKPIGGVEVRLYQDPYNDGDEVSYIGFSDTSGDVYLTPAGQSAPPFDSTPWIVGVLSDGDGSWMLDPKFNDPAKSGLELQVGSAGASGQTVPIIRLPSGSVRSLIR